ncbi:MAG: DUF2892 domain-containing protein [Bacteroidetes bacterium]|nr:MAG: DUF2892 domain-containing protein [Bacteroidota bacterium]REK05241.1 MAG: DUF2892 domain-containing protein [Bacteroidota bacterium]REK32646.1 MAG: DUF2892 domain-containing protein [Bacteroidota bacterium]REK48907.1 MAG: DUF2892 domain-containing protein [Bacteroidota bacterium]
MKANMGKTDRMIRTMLAIVFLAFYALEVVTGFAGIVLIVLALVFVATSLISFCPLYLPFGLSTCRKSGKSA